MELYKLHISIITLSIYLDFKSIRLDYLRRNQKRHQRLLNRQYIQFKLTVRNLMYLKNIKLGNRP